MSACRRQIYTRTLKFFFKRNSPGKPFAPINSKFIISTSLSKTALKVIAKTILESCHPPSAYTTISSYINMLISPAYSASFGFSCINPPCVTMQLTPIFFANAEPFKSVCVLVYLKAGGTSPRISGPS